MNPILEAFQQAIQENGGEVLYDDVYPLLMTPELFRHSGRIDSVWQVAEAEGIFYRSVEKRDGDVKPRLRLIAGSRPQA